MAKIPLNIVDGAYADDVRPFSSQECVNWIPEASESEGSRTPSILRGAPGMRVYSYIGEGPIRGTHSVEGRLFVVSGFQLWEVASDGSAVLRGVVPGTGRVQMAHNQIAGGNQLCIGIGSSGYVYNTVTQALVRITDTGFGGGRSPQFIDNYMAWLATDGTFWFHSQLSDALDYNTLDRYGAEASPDPIVALLVSNREVWAFGARTTEIYQNVGADTNTFQRVTTIQQGCGGQYAVAELDNGVFWLGDDGIIYRANGYSPQRISTHAIEQKLSRLRSEWADARAFTWTDYGHKVFYLTVGDLTLGYDAATGKWHRRESYGVGRWRADSMVFCYGLWLAGDYRDNRLYAVDWATYTEDDQPLVARRVSGVLSNNQDRMTVHGFELIMDTGFGRSAGDELLITENDEFIVTEDGDRFIVGSVGGDFKVTLRYSDDGGYTWSNFRERSLGALGRYGTRLEFFRLGQFRQRVWDIQIASPVKRDLLGAVMEAEANG